MRRVQVKRGDANEVKMVACTTSSSRISCVVQLELHRKGDGGKFGSSTLSVGLSGQHCRSVESAESVRLRDIKKQKTRYVLDCYLERSNLLCDSLLVFRAWQSFIWIRIV